MTNDNHDPLRDLIHQSLVSDKLTPSIELRTEVEQRLDDEVVISPAKPQAETMPHRRMLRAWHVALVVAAALVVMVYFSLPEKWQRAEKVISWTFHPQAQPKSWTDSPSAIDAAAAQGKLLMDRGDSMLSSSGPNAEFGHSLTADANLLAPNDGYDEHLADIEAVELDPMIDSVNVQAYGGTVTTKLRADAPRLQEGQLTARESGRTGPSGKPMGFKFGNSLNGEPAPAVPARIPEGETDQYAYTHRTKTNPELMRKELEKQIGDGYVDLTPSNSKQTGPRAGEGDAEQRIRLQVTPRIIVQKEDEKQLGLGLESAKAQLASEQSARRAALSKLTARLSVVANDQDRGREVAKLSEQVKELSDQIATNEARAEYLLRLDEAPGTEQYDAISDNPFLPVKDAPLSTFSIDVDTASYANVRRFLTQGQIPPGDAVRIEELLNYFSYDYPAPKGDEPFSVNMETAPCPWREEHLLLRVALRGKEVHKAERPASNLVFLIDTSGSMSDEDKLPLVKQALSMLTRELGERDKITIVTYAGEAGLKLAPTNGGDTGTITSVINSLNSGGSTHGSAGIQLAYEKAREQFIKEGTNRVILCTDGDLNVGITQDDQLVDLIGREAKTGVFLTVLGFGQGNLKDSKMEKLADHGNGVYAYIDGVREAKKVLVDQIAGTLETIAKDVKIQIEFNPSQIRGYRLIGYENRILAAKDFNDDTKDAGEIGAGHTVTALYELVPAGAAEPRPVLDDLKYQQRAESVSDRSAPGEGEKGRGGEGATSKELLTLKLRYKKPDGDVSTKVEYPLSERGSQFRAASADFRFAASVAAFGMILRDSPYRGAINMGGVGEIAASSLGDDARGYRAEFLDLVRRAEKLGKR